MPLAAAGQALLDDAAPGHVRRVRHWIFEALDDDDLAALTRITTKLNEHLNLIADCAEP